MKSVMYNLGVNKRNGSRESRNDVSNLDVQVTKQ